MRIYVQDDFLLCQEKCPFYLNQPEIFRMKPVKVYPDRVLKSRYRHTLNN